MEYDTQLIYVENKSRFDAELDNNNILKTSICFIDDTLQIWTHNRFYNCYDYKFEGGKDSFTVTTIKGSETINIETRTIKVNNSPIEGDVNFLAGEGIILESEGNNVVISAELDELNKLIDVKNLYSYISINASITYEIPNINNELCHHTIIYNNSEQQITISIPTNCICVTDNLTIDPGRYGEINALKINEKIYVRAV